MKQNDTIKLLKKLVFILIFIPSLMYSQETITWNVAGAGDWGTAANWSPSQVPTAEDNVIINTSGADVEISGTTAAFVKTLVVLDGTLTVESGASLIVSEGAVGDIIYELSIPDDQYWHYVSSPVVGQEYTNTGWADSNHIATSASGNRGIATYDNSASIGAAGHWRYFQAASTDTELFETGIGYSLLTQAGTTLPNTYTFTGTYNTGDVMPAISQGVVNWNLLGNPYPSYLDIEAFIAANASNLSAEFQAIYIWHQASGANKILTTGYIHPGQSFMIHSNVASGNASITEAMQRPLSQFYRTNTTHPSIKVTLSDGASTKNTQINYLENTTKGLDPGFDLGMFDDGTSSNSRIFTHLVEDNQGIAFGRQAVPNSDLESMVIPVGLKVVAGEEITFSLEALNLPTDVKVFLEDKVTNTFTRLDEANTDYTVTLSETLDGIGRFYIHTSASALTVDDAILSTVHVYKSDVSTLRIVGLPQGNTTVKLYNVLGKQVLNTSFDNDAKDISLPKLAKGVYIVAIQTAIGKLNKKIILE
ncbi:MAG: T9SS type A sorting domain-containing protein [Polaribacter sp.]